MSSNISSKERMLFIQQIDEISVILNKPSVQSCHNFCDIEKSLFQLFQFVQLKDDFLKKEIGLNSNCLQGICLQLQRQVVIENKDIVMLCLEIFIWCNHVLDHTIDRRIRSILGSLGICDIIKRILQVYMDSSSEIIAKTFQSIFTLARDDGNRQKFGSLGICELISEIMLKWSNKHELVAWEGMKACLNLACDDLNRSKLGNSNICEIVIQCLTQYGMTNSELAWDGIWCVANLSFDYENRRKFAHAKAVLILFQLFQTWHGNQNIILNFCSALHNLSFEVENILELQGIQGCKLMCDLLSSSRNNSEILEKCFSCLSVMCFHPNNEKQILKTLPVILHIVKESGNEVNIAWCGCCLLWSILTCYGSQLSTQIVADQIFQTCKDTIWNRWQQCCKSQCIKILQSDDGKMKNLKNLKKNLFCPSLYTSCLQEDWALAELLIELASDNQEMIGYIHPVDGKSVLHIAVFQNCPTHFMKKLLALPYADPTLLDVKGISLIFTAVSRNVNLDLVKLLLDDGRIDLNLPTERGWTPLHIAAYLGTNPKMCQLLCDYGAKCDLKATLVIATPIQLAALHSTVEARQVLRVLLLSGHGKIDSEALARAKDNKYTYEYLRKAQLMMILCSVYRAGCGKNSTIRVLPLDLLKHLKEYLFVT
jgi:ankyrin repeat protein